MTGDVVDLIMQDHREVERLFDELRNHPEKRLTLVPLLTTLLTAHSRAEEAQVYPVARTEAGETEEVAHSQEEHAQAEGLLEQLAAVDPRSPRFDEVLARLVEAVDHHVQEEESRVLSGMRQRLSDERRTQLGVAFADSRRQHLGEQPGEATREELETQARNVGMSDASAAAMSREDLGEQLKG